MWFMYEFRIYSYQQAFFVTNNSEIITFFVLSFVLYHYEDSIKFIRHLNLEKITNKKTGLWPKMSLTPLVIVICHVRLYINLPKYTVDLNSAVLTYKCIYRSHLHSSYILSVENQEHCP